MLEINIPGREVFNDVTWEFINYEPVTLQLEHTLVSVAEWESKWQISFLDSEKTPDQVRDYVRCMTLNRESVSDDAYQRLTKENMVEINAYLENPMSATRIYEHGNSKTSGGSKEKVTAEVIYYWMFSHNIPLDFQYWHFNRLITLIKTCNIKSNPEKMTKQETAQYYAKLNAERKAKMKTKG